MLQPVNDVKRVRNELTSLLISHRNGTDHCCTRVRERVSRYPEILEFLPQWLVFQGDTGNRSQKRIETLDG